MECTRWGGGGVRTVHRPSAAAPTAARPRRRPCDRDEHKKSATTATWHAPRVSALRTGAPRRPASCPRPASGPACATAAGPWRAARGRASGAASRRGAGHRRENASAVLADVRGCVWEGHNHQKPLMSIKRSRLRVRQPPQKTHPNPKTPSLSLSHARMLYTTSPSSSSPPCWRAASAFSSCEMRRRRRRYCSTVTPDSSPQAEG